MKKIFVFWLLVSPLVAHTQSTLPYMRVLAGNMKSLKPLRKEKSYNVVFSYDSMLVGRDIPETEFLAQKKEVWEVKEPGKGAEFEKMWFEDRKQSYEPTFIRNFEKFAYVKVDAAAKYTLIIKTIRTEGGWNFGVAQSPAMLDLELWVVETADQNKMIVRIEFPEIKGRKYQGGDFEMTQRINDAYLYASKALGDFFHLRI